MENTRVRRNLRAAATSPLEGGRRCAGDDLHWVLHGMASSGEVEARCVDCGFEQLLMSSARICSRYRTTDVAPKDAVSNVECAWTDNGCGCC